MRIEAEAVRALEVAVLRHGQCLSADRLLLAASGQRDRHATGLGGRREVLEALWSLSHGDCVGSCSAK